MSILDELLEATDQIGLTNTALSGLTDTLKLLDNAASASIASIQNLSKATAQFAADGQAASKAAEGAAKAAGATGAAGGKAAKGFDAIGDSAQGALDKLKPSGGIIGKVTDALSGLGPKGQAAAVVIGILVTVVTAAAVAFWSLVKSAIAISQEKDALAETFGALSSGAKSGIALVNELSDVAARLPFDEGKVLAWGKSLLAVGKDGAALEQSILAVASATALMGDQGGAAAEGLVKRFQLMADTGQKVKLDRRILTQLAEAGVSAKALAAELGVAPDALGKTAIAADQLGAAMERTLIEKGAGALQKMSLTWGSITGKLGDAWGDLFEDLGPAVEPLMTAIRDFFGEFSAGTTLQGAAKSALTDFFTTVFGWATKAMRAIHIGFLQAQIAGLKLYIALAPIIGILVAIFTNAMVLQGLKAIFYVIVAAIAVVVGSFLLVQATVAAVFGIVVAIVVAAVGVISTVLTTIVDFIADFIAALVTGGTEGAAEFLNGIIEGITSGAGKVWNSITDLAKGMQDAFTGFFQISSPSRLMKKHGRQLPAGAAEGVDDGAIQLEKSMDNVWEMPKKKRGGAAREGGRKLAETITIIFKGRSDEFDDFRVQMESWLDQQEAAGPEPEPA